MMEWVQDRACMVMWLIRMTVLGIRRTGPQQPLQREERGARTRPGGMRRDWAAEHGPWKCH